MKKNLIMLIAIFAFVLAISATAIAATKKATLINSNGDKVVVAVGSTEAQYYFGLGYVLLGQPFKVVETKCTSCQELGSISPNITGDKFTTKKIAKTSVFSTTTLSAADSGTLFLISASGTTITLPRATTTGLNYKFVVAGDITTASTSIASYYGDNIEGSLIVAGAVADCDAADVVYFDSALENIGDYVELTSTGSYWVVTGSGILTADAAKCSG